MENEIMVREDENGELEVYEMEPEAPEEGKSNFMGKLLAGIGIASAIGGAIYWFKNKDEIRAKRAERKAEKLRKQGYVVYRADEDLCVECDDTEFVDED